MQRMTKQKKAILAAMHKAQRPLTPQEVLLKAQTQVPALGIATVYRNLKQLMEDDCIRSVELPAQAARYEVVHHGHEHHHHFLCSQCGRAFDVHGCMEDFVNLVPPGFKVQDHDITLYGLCADCVRSDSQNQTKKQTSKVGLSKA